MASVLLVVGEPARQRPARRRPSPAGAAFGSDTPPRGVGARAGLADETGLPHRWARTTAGKPRLPLPRDDVVVRSVSEGDERGLIGKNAMDLVA